ncbi:TPA: hypothetical protein ACKBDR_000790, partial [Streptococcus pneumoniae]
FYRSEHQKRKDEICPFSSLAFLQPTTVDKEPFIYSIKHEAQKQAKNPIEWLSLDYQVRHFHQIRSILLLFY